ncbi:hypothetical protein scyTo_0010189, partial [Scyliorhinus torazame]|nr:hypothetical protein [Scyliorhinus torazame]
MRPSEWGQPAFDLRAPLLRFAVQPALGRRSQWEKMAATQDVHVRICAQEIIKYDLEIKALVQDIRDSPGPLSLLTELNAKVKEMFQQLRLRIQDLEQMAKEQDKESDKQILLAEVENHRKQML